MNTEYLKIPESIMENLLHYVKGEESPSGFLYAVLCNDLFGAVEKADKEMKPLIHLLCQYIHSKLPGGCHGSREIVKLWMQKDLKKGK